MKSSVLTRLVRVDEWDAMCAEVERLRVINADLRLMIDGLETAAHEERAAVVAWLRGQTEQLMAEEATVTAYVIRYFASDIERGEHRREEER